MTRENAERGWRRLWFVVMALSGLLLLLLWENSIARAQESGGSIVGTVSDPTGAAVPNAGVTVKNVGTGVVRDVQTNGEGLFAAPNLIPGTYEITVTASGFATAVVSDV